MTIKPFTWEPDSAADDHEPQQRQHPLQVVVTTLAVAGVSIRLARPVEPDRLLDDPLVNEWNRRDDYMPYGAYLWPSAFLLAEVLARASWFERNDRSNPGVALEIGCGLGLPGLVAVARGLSVHFTDYDPAPLKLVARSAEENGFDRGRYAISRLDWRELPSEQYPLIMGADVLYEARLVPLVVRLLDKMLAPAGEGLITSPHRVTAERFPAALAEVGLVCQTDTTSARSADGQMIEGLIYRVTR